MLSNGRGADDRKIIVRQLDFHTSQTTIEQYFSQYGPIREVFMKFNEMGRSKGFCFVTFNESSSAEEVLKGEHEIDGRAVQVKRAMDGGSNTTCKLFCGGLPHALAEEDLQSYFEQYGTIKGFEFIFDKGTQMRKHFCFITFEDGTSVDRIVEGKLPPSSVIHHIGKYRVECKKKFDDNHPIQKKVKAAVNQKKREHESWGPGPTPAAPAYPGAAPPYHPSTTAPPSYHGHHHHDPYSYGEAAYEGGSEYGAYPGYHDHYSYPPYAYRDPYGYGYERAPAPHMGGFTGYPGYAPAGHPGGGPMKARGGGRGGGRGSYRPY